MPIKKIIFLLSLFLFSACAKAPTALTAPTTIPTPFPNTLYVDPSVSLGKISPLVYGSNYGPWSAISVDGLPLAYDSGISILRFPAGNWGDRNDVQTYQIDQFMYMLQKMNATAMINVRLLGGTPEQAAEMVRYVNIEKKYNVTYWGIGNEPTLYNGELKNKGDSYDVARFNKEWRTFALAMKKVDPNIKLVGPEMHQFSFDYTPGATTNYTQELETWLKEFLKANGDLVDIVSFHRYPFPFTRTSGPASVDDLRNNTQEWDKIITHARDIIHKETGRDLPIAITEFNSDYVGPAGTDATPDSHYNAIWMGDVLGRMIKNGVFMANQWQLVSSGGISSSSGLISRGTVFPDYYTYQMYKMFGDELIYSSSDQPDLSIYAAKKDDGTLTVMVINLSMIEQEKALRITDSSAAEAESWLFDPSHHVENMGTVQIAGNLKFPAQSMTLFIIQ